MIEYINFPSSANLTTGPVPDMATGCSQTTSLKGSSDSAGVPLLRKQRKSQLLEKVYVLRIVFATFLMISTASLAQTPFNHPCPDHTVPERTVTICTPTQGAVVRGRFMIFVAHITDSLSFQTSTILNGVPTGGSTSSDQNFVIGFPNPGPNRVTIKVTDSSGTFESSILVNSIQTPTLCTASPTNQTITICAPLDGDQQTSPVEMAAVTTDSNPLNATQVYVDRVKAAEGNTDEANFVLTHVLLEPGPHRVTFQALEKSGLIIRKAIHISVR